MKEPSTFADWDFADIWDIAEGQTYPFLRRHSAEAPETLSRIDFADLAVLAGDWPDNGDP